MASVTLNEITKRWGDFTAVDQVSLEVRDQEFMVLLGPSGCGKTTTMRMVAGLEEPSEGEIFIGEKMVNDELPKDRDVAMVFQNYGLYPHMSVYENIRYPLKVRKVDKSLHAEQVRIAAEKVQLGHLLKRRPRELSGGQRQRVALARAIVRTPTVFLMDEPLSNLDAKLRVNMRAELKHLQHELKITTIYVTHDQIEAMTMATHVGVLDNGKLVQFGTPREIYENPVSVYAASRLGQPRINVLPADVFGVAPDGAASIGLRPEHIVQGEGEESMVTRVEHLGDQTRLHLAFKNHDLITVTDAHTTLNEGDVVKIRPNNPYYFDANGARVA